MLTPLCGLLLVLPIAAHSVVRTAFFITVEFLLAFVELLLDAIPGLLLRLNDGILDHAPAILGRLPLWFPSPLHDQHLSGDFLWFIAEIADVPVLVLLFVRWMRLDRREGTASRRAERRGDGRADPSAPPPAGLTALPWARIAFKILRIRCC